MIRELGLLLLAGLLFFLIGVLLGIINLKQIGAF